jgi:hypothetical protein
MPTEAASVLHRPTALGVPLRPAFEGPQAGAVLQEASTLDELAQGFVYHRDGESRFVGIDPDQDLHTRAPPFSVVPLLLLAREGHSDFGPCSHTSFESLRTPRSPAGRKPRTSQPIIWATGNSRAIPKTGALKA